MRQLPIEITYFKKIITENYHYIDKSLFIKELLDEGIEVYVNFYISHDVLSIFRARFLGFLSVW